LTKGREQEFTGDDDDDDRLKQKQHQKVKRYETAKSLKFRKSCDWHARLDSRLSRMNVFYTWTYIDLTLITVKS
jgi:uncharacterized damage-inducible protein DinB